MQDWLVALPPLAIYLTVAAVIGAESMGIPMPGEVTLVTAALLATSGVTNLWTLAIAASAGAIVGDSIGYAIGRRGGRPLLLRLGRRFPRHLGPKQLGRAEWVFQRWGLWAVFFGRFFALLRILAGPLAGALRVPYPRFLLANAAGGVFWAAGTTAVVYYVGRAAERWLKDFSWAALVVAVVVGLGAAVWLRARAKRRTASAAEPTLAAAQPAEAEA